MRSHGCGDLRAEAAGQAVELCGWVDRRRDHGGVIFIDLRDRSGTVQITVDPDLGAETFGVAEHLRNETVIQVAGTVRERPAESINDRLATGRVEVLAGAITVLNAVKGNLPFPVSVHDEENTREELRLRHRYLDLRRERMNGNLRLRAQTIQAARRFLEDQGFIEVETPVLTRSTPEGARDYLVPSRVCGGEWFALPQSPQLFKQLLMVGGIERYYQVARCFRDEDLRADRQLEFTQIDIEASFITREDIITMAEGLMAALWAEAGITVTTPFPRMSYADAMERYGCDRPDLRYGLEIRDLTPAFANSESGIIQSAIAAGGRVRGIVVPGAASWSRKQVDELEAIAKGAGAGGLVRLKLAEGKLEGPLAKFLAADAAAALGLNEGDLLLAVAGADRISSPALDRVRQECAARLNLTDPNHREFLWVLDFPMFDKDPETGALAAVHHPFTSPNTEDMAARPDAPETWRAFAYDCVLNGTELGGGSIRTSDPAVQARMFELLGIGDAAEQERRFGFLLEGLRAGAPPHGGIAFGFDRIAMILAGAESLRDVIAFPKTTAARALFEGAPSQVPAQDLDELHIRVQE